MRPRSDQILIGLRVAISSSKRLERNFSWIASFGPEASAKENAGILLAARLGKIAGKIFFLTRVLPLLFDARSQLDLIRIIGIRCATRQ